ncbi:hypothetical protein [Vibrio vulnificus]|nr:hypothetical protein [Vibrio vulnificus]
MAVVRCGGRGGSWCACVGLLGQKETQRLGCVVVGLMKGVS